MGRSEQAVLGHSIEKDLAHAAVLKGAWYEEYAVAQVVSIPHKGPATAHLSTGSGI